MRLKKLVLALTVTSLMAIAALGAGPATGAATGLPCRSVHAGGYSATHVFVDFMSCRSARTRLASWLRRGQLPRNSSGWYCSRLGGVVRQCSYPGRRNPSRDFTFWLRRTG